MKKYHKYVTQIAALLYMIYEDIEYGAGDVDGCDLDEIIEGMIYMVVGVLEHCKAEHDHVLIALRDRLVELQNSAISEHRDYYARYYARTRDVQDERD